MKMPATPKRRPRARKSQPIVLINGEPIRKQARRDYEEARDKLAKARQQIDRFNEEDRPAFERWLNGTFGAQLTAVRDLSREQQEKFQLIEQIERLSFMEGIGIGEAYKIVMHFRAHPEDMPPPPEQKSGGKNQQERPAEDEEPDIDDFEEADFEKFAREFTDFLDGKREMPFAAKEDQDRRLKDLYRALARKLHPDAQKEMTPQKLEWWHEAQEAYEEGDVERLEMILSLCELQEETSSAHTSVSMLRRIIEQINASLREVKREISQYRREPAWNFLRRKDRSQLARQAGDELVAEIEKLRRAIADFDRLLDRWARDLDRSADRPQTFRRRRTRQQNQFWS